MNQDRNLSSHFPPFSSATLNSLIPLELFANGNWLTNNCLVCCIFIVSVPSFSLCIYESLCIRHYILQLWNGRHSKNYSLWLPKFFFSFFFFCEYETTLIIPKQSDGLFGRLNILLYCLLFIKIMIMNCCGNVCEFLFTQSWWLFPNI